MVAYRGTLLAARVMVPREVPAGFQYPAVPEVNFVDREVFAKLKRLNIVPSDVASDAEFLRRVTLDTIGCLPTPDEVRAFLADKAPDKRTKKIDELLAHPMHAALWATKFCDITGNNTDQLEQPVQFRTKRSQMWHDWFRKRVVDNMPYDEIVRGVLCATSRDGQSPEDWIKQARRHRRGRPERLRHSVRRAGQPRPVLAPPAGRAAGAVGREDGGRVPRHSPGMRPVPQASLRPLDAGRLSGVCQRLRGA